MTVDQEITLMQAGKIISFLGSETEINQAIVGEVQLIQGDTTVSEPRSVVSARRSVREALESANAKSHAQKITVFGQFIAKSNASELFTTDEIKEQYQAAREKSPGNHFSRELDNAVSSGWIAPAQGQKNTYYVTQKGEKVIDESFATSAKTRVKAKSNSSKSAIVSESDVSEAVRVIQPIVPTLEGYPNYHKLSSKGLKIMWLLAMAQSNHIDSLATKEISFLASKLRDKIEIRDMSGHTVTGAKNGWITKNGSSDYILLHDGDDYLRSLLSEDAAN